MRERTLETDYLVIGSGAAGMAFTDTLIGETKSEVVMIDRRNAPGGHWNDAYGFVRLHQPSMYYGVSSMPLGGDAIETYGPDTGLYERASGAEIRAYYDRVMSRRFLPSGQVRFLAQHDHVGEGRVVSMLTGETTQITVRKKIVDARYLSPNIPSKSAPPFEVGAGATVVPVNRLTQLDETPERFVIIGGGKTAMDACVWLLQSGVDPGRIRWIKPREACLVNRHYAQPGALVGSLFQGIALQIESAARSTSADDLIDRLHDTEQLLRVDMRVRPTMYKGSTIADWEIQLLRRIEDVVRLGHVRRVDREQIVLEHGTLPTSPKNLHVHCAADGLRRPPPLPMFAPRSITLQPMRSGLIPFNAAMVAFIEAHRQDDAEKNRLCPINPFMDTANDWARTLLIQMNADRLWSKEPDIVEWLERTRLNPSRGLRDQFGDPEVLLSAQRFGEHVRPALARLKELSARG